MSTVPPHRMAFGPLPADPLVSVLMPVYNAGDFLAPAIESIINQTYANWELLTLDDGSTDNSANVLRQQTDPRVRTLSNATNQGYLSACNRLFTEAKGELITFLDADDISVPERLEVCVAAFQENGELGYLTTGFCRIAPKGEVLSRELHGVDHERYATNADYYPVMCGASIMLRAELLEHVGGYHPFFEKTGGEDYHWLFRLSCNAAGTHLHPPLYHYRTHPAQTNQQNSSQLKFFAEDIDRQVRRTLIEKGNDLLDAPDALLDSWNRHLRENPHELAFRIGASALNRGHRAEAFISALRTIVAAPLRIKSWELSAYLTYSIIRRYLDLSK